MGTGKWTEDYFRKRLKSERDSRGWTQREMEKLLSDRGIPMHWTTIAKIEKGDRSVRIDEAAAIADLFELSLDSLMGRKAKLENEHLHTLRAVFDTAQQCGWQVAAIRTTLGDR